MNKNTRERMDGYVSALERIRNHRFIERIMIGKGWSWNLKAGTDQEATFTYDSPTEEEVDAIIATARLLAQDNDFLSFKNMAKLADDPGVSEEWKEGFRRARRMLNNYLDQPWEIVINNEPLMNRDLFDTILYGYLVHKNADKSKRVEIWKSDPAIWIFYWSQFCSCVYELLFASLCVVDLCRFELRGDVIELPN